MLTPMEIHNKDFKRATIRGYKEDDVEEFLDRVAADYEKLYRENEKLKEQANLNEKEISQFRRLEKNLQDTLMVAQKTAEEVISSAKKNAEEMRNNTQQECQNIREEAKMEARRRMDDAANKISVLTAEYDRLLREKNDFLLKIRTALESELAVTVQLLNSTPHPKEVNSSVTPVTSPIDDLVSKTESESEPISKSESQPKSEVDIKIDDEPHLPASSVSISPITSDMPIAKISIDK